MRHLLTALCLLPTLAIAQQLHTFKNGEVADADKINENFDALKEQLLLQTHPEGDLWFRYSDEASNTTLLTPNVDTRDPESIALDQANGSSWGPITQNIPRPSIYTQRGISFERHVVSRMYPFVVNPHLCTAGAVIGFPIEVLETFSNQYGSITQGTSWDFGDSGSPNPEAMANNSAGLYLCYDYVKGGFWLAGYLDIKGATGRYRCARSSKEFLFGIQHVHVDLSPTRESSYAALSAVEGLSSADFTSNIYFGTGAISADIPATCETAEVRSSIATPSHTVMTIFGIEVEIPPNQSD